MPRARGWWAGGVLVAVLLQAPVLSTGCARRPTTLAVELTGLARGAARPLPVGADVASGLDEVVVSGASTVECRLFVFTLQPSGAVRRILAAGDPELGDIVGPGPFRLRGGYQFEQAIPTLRLFGVCGGPDLRFTAIASAVRAAVAEAGGGAEAVDRLARIPGLDEQVAQVSAFYRTR
jgi:hypothetical protein